MRTSNCRTDPLTGASRETLQATIALAEPEMLSLGLEAWGDGGREGRGRYVQFAYRTIREHLVPVSAQTPLQREINEEFLRNVNFGMLVAWFEAEIS